MTLSLVLAQPIELLASINQQGRIQAQSIWPGGTSGVPDNPNYFNMLPLWLSNDTILLQTRKHKIKHAAQHRIIFKPQN